MCVQEHSRFTVTVGSRQLVQINVSRNRKFGRHVYISIHPLEPME